jgi:hypothetical protein
VEEQEHSKELTFVWSEFPDILLSEKKKLLKRRK